MMPRESPTQPLGNFSGWTCRCAAARKALRLIRRTDQAVDQHVPQVLVSGVGVYRQKLFDCFVAGVLTQQHVKPLPTFGPVDWVSHIGRKQLYRILPQFCDLIFLIFQIDRITHMVTGAMLQGQRRWGPLFLRDSLLNGFIFLIGHGNVDLMGRLVVAYGDGVSLAGDGLAG